MLLICYAVHSRTAVEPSPNKIPPLTKSGTITEVANIFLCSIGCSYQQITSCLLLVASSSTNHCFKVHFLSTQRQPAFFKAPFNNCTALFHLFNLRPFAIFIRISHVVCGTSIHFKRSRQYRRIFFFFPCFPLLP